MDAPDISFCLPVYNSAERIERCLRAVLAQTGPTREILVVDNGSTDDTVAKARTVLAGVPVARLILNGKNLGRIENWNRCLELAEGKYVKFALVNDVLLPGSAEMLWRAARSNPEAGMICSRPRNMDAMPSVLEAVPPHPTAEVYDPVGALQRMARHGNDTGAPGGMLLRGEVIRREGLKFRPDIPFWSDFDFAIKMAQRGPVVYVDAESYLFDLSVAGRFARTGLKNYYGEGAECARVLAAALAKHGIEGWNAFEFLERQYTAKTWNYQQEPLRPAATKQVFRGAGPYQTSAHRYAVRHRAKQIRQRAKHYLQRAGSRLGVYHYPSEKKK